MSAGGGTELNCCAGAATAVGVALGTNGCNLSPTLASCSWTAVKFTGSIPGDGIVLPPTRGACGASGEGIVVRVGPTGAKVAL